MGKATMLLIAALNLGGNCNDRPTPKKPLPWSQGQCTPEIWNDQGDQSAWCVYQTSWWYCQWKRYPGTHVEVDDEFVCVRAGEATPAKPKELP